MLYHYPNDRTSKAQLAVCISAAPAVLQQTIDTFGGGIHLLFDTTGSGRLDDACTALTLRSGEAIRFAGHTIVIRGIPGSRPRLHLVLFNEAFARQALIPPYGQLYRTLYNTTVTLPDVTPHCLKVVSHLLAVLYYAGRHPQGSDGESLLRLSFTLLLDQLAALLVPKRSLSRKEVQAAVFFRLLQEHYREAHTTQFYADKLFITRGHLSKIIRQVSGKSPKKAIEETLLGQARLLLKDPERTLGSIAETLGFSSGPFFSAFFKKHTSESPAAYRKRLFG
jgi:AraC-like DNA-binding protein